jgi:hypothetical protein
VHTFGYGLHGRGVEVLLAAEVIVKESLVDSCGFGDLLGARPGQAVFTELEDGGGEDARTGLIGSFGLGAGWRRCVHI